MPRRSFAAERALTRRSAEVHLPGHLPYWPAGRLLACFFPVVGRSSRLRPPRVLETQRQRLFYTVFLPLGVVANLGLGLYLIAGLNPQAWPDWLQVCTGALCCAIAGWLAAAAWSKSYWHRNMAAQVATWRRISDALFTWIEEVPVPPESLHSLKSSLEEAVPGSERR